MLVGELSLTFCDGFKEQFSNALCLFRFFIARIWINKWYPQKHKECPRCWRVNRIKTRVHLRSPFFDCWNFRHLARWFWQNDIITFQTIALSWTPSLVRHQVVFGGSFGNYCPGRNLHNYQVHLLRNDGEIFHDSSLELFSCKPNDRRMSTL